jgi:NAD(P)-dependent dehydrogenase (short-subunit alcohol dehydrogenase family)
MGNDQETLLITGGAGGIGAACARRLAARMAVVIADADLSAAETLAAELRAAGRTALAVQVDVASRASVAAMMARITGELGPVHALFNNAGISLRNRVEDITEADWDRMMAVHVKGMAWCAQAVLPGMLARGAGVIINNSSEFAIVGMPGAAAYAAAKTAVYGLTKALVAEFSRRGIRINALGPGPIDTPLLRAGRDGAQFAEVAEFHRRTVPMGRLGQPEEIAALLDFLLGPGASYINGQIIHPNGGRVTW